MPTSPATDRPLVAALALKDALLAESLGGALGAEEVVDRVEITSDMSGLTAVIDALPEADVVVITETQVIDAPGAEVIDGVIAQSAGRVSVLVLCSSEHVADFGRMSARFGARWALIARQSCTLDRLTLAIRSLRSGLLMFEPCQAAGIDSAPVDLTDQEREVLRWVAYGLSNIAVAERMTVSEKTVERVLRSCYRKLDLDGTATDSNSRVVASLMYHGIATELPSPIVNGAG